MKWKKSSCPICKDDCFVADQPGPELSFDCARCGKYQVPRQELKALAAGTRSVRQDYLNATLARGADRNLVWLMPVLALSDW
jgi:hypothetical protein